MDDDVSSLYGGRLAAYNATMSRIRPEISKWVKRHPVDGVVIVREVYRRVPGGPSEYFGGVGIHQFVNREPIVQAVFGLVIWDGETLAQITELSYAPAAGIYDRPVAAVLASSRRAGTFRRSSPR